MISCNHGKEAADSRKAGDGYEGDIAEGSGHGFQGGSLFPPKR